LCNEPDTVLHRITSCTAADAPVPLPGSFLDALLPLVAEAAPRPSSAAYDSPHFLLATVYEGQVTFENVDDPGHEASSTWFTDGSCQAPNIPDAMASGVAVTLFDGTPLRGRYFRVGALT
jgi:hypothetical protein